MHHISGTVKHMITIFGTLALNADISRVFFTFLKFSFLGLLGVKGQKLSKMKNNYIRHKSYLRTVYKAYNHDFQYTFVK